jgi:hypothetical protein
MPIFVCQLACLYPANVPLTVRMVLGLKHHLADCFFRLVIKNTVTSERVAIFALSRDSELDFDCLSVGGNMSC